MITVEMRAVLAELPADVRERVLRSLLARAALLLRSRE